MKVTKVNVVNGGSGWFDEPPIVTLYGGGGTGAKCQAVVKAGRVIGVDVVDGGVNYSAEPEVRFDGGGRCVGVPPVAFAVVAEGGQPFHAQPVPKPENPPKEPKSTPPVHAETPHEESRPMQSLKPKPTPDEKPGQQHTEGERRSQFNPGGAPSDPKHDEADPKHETAPKPGPAPKDQPPAAPIQPPPARGPAFQPPKTDKK